jgi:hypothetical protein
LVTVMYSSAPREFIRAHRAVVRSDFCRTDGGRKDFVDGHRR